MEKVIVTRLKEIEEKYDIKIILAVESGSRAWGFPSKNSDWDVRFIYVHRPPYYASIHPGKDNIQIMDKELDLDFSGWELRKALGLLYKGNPPLLEWLKSPMVYMSMPEAVSELRNLAEGYYDVKSAIYHYIHMADGNWRSYVNERPMVEMKKYLYIFRPLLACKHIEQMGTMAPMEIDKTLKYLDNTVDQRFNDLLALKRHGVELGQMPTDPAFNDWIKANMEHYKRYVQTLPKVSKDSTLLDKYLFKWMKEAWH